MQSIIKTYQLDDYFAFGGEQSNIDHEYARADALVLVSKYEGSPNVVCETIACQLPLN